MFSRSSTLWRVRIGQIEVSKEVVKVRMSFNRVKGAVPPRCLDSSQDRNLLQKDAYAKHEPLFAGHFPFPEKSAGPKQHSTEPQPPQ